MGVGWTAAGKTDGKKDGQTDKRQRQLQISCWGVADWVQGTDWDRVAVAVTAFDYDHKPDSFRRLQAAIKTQQIASSRFTGPESESALDC